MSQPKFEIRKSKNNQFYYALIAGNGECIGTGETHPSKQRVQSEIESVKKNVPIAKIVDETYACV